MKRSKWQGIACFLLASLMVGSSFAAPIRNEKPTSVPSQTATPNPNPTPGPKEVQKPGETPKPMVTPNTSKPTPAPTKPVAKPSSTPTVPAPQPSPASGKPEIKPCHPCQPIEKPNGSVQKPDKLGKPDQPAQNPNPPANMSGVMPCKPAEKISVPSTKPCVPEQKTGQKPGCNTQKPFMLDHFKMIVNALKKLGVEEKKIVTHIKEGKKLEDILKAEKIKPKKFKKCILKEYNKVVDEAQKKGQITCEQSKQLKVAIKETINSWLPVASK